MILLLFTLTSCVSARTFLMSVTSTSYQAEEDQDVTLEWPFSILINRLLSSFSVYCELFTEDRPSTMFYLREGVEEPESQDQQFKGRVHCDKDVLREGRLRLQVSRLKTNDSGEYQCQVIINQFVTICKRRLTVTAARDPPKPAGTNGARLGWIGIYCGLGLIAAALLAACVCLFSNFPLMSEDYSSKPPLLKQAPGTSNPFC